MESVHIPYGHYCGEEGGRYAKEIRVAAWVPFRVCTSKSAGKG